MIYERLEELDPAKFEVDAAKLLHGLGFGKAMMAKATKDMSGLSCTMLLHHKVSTQRDTVQGYAERCLGLM